MVSIGRYRAVKMKNKQTLNIFFWWKSERVGYLIKYLLDSINLHGFLKIHFTKLLQELNTDKPLYVTVRWLSRIVDYLKSI